MQGAKSECVCNCLEVDRFPGALYKQVSGARDHCDSAVPTTIKSVDAGLNLSFSRSSILPRQTIAVIRRVSRMS